MSNRQAIAFNTMSQIAGKIITSGTTFVVSMLIARSLGAAGYGDFTKITTFVAFFYLFADFGLNAAYLELSEDKRAYQNLLTIRILMGLGLMFLCISILSFLPGTAVLGYTPIVKLGIIIFSISILLQSFITTANAFFQKHMRYDLASYALGIGSLLTLFAVSAFLYFNITGVLPSIIAFILGSGMTVITSLFFVKKIIPGFSFTPDTSLTKKMLSISLPLGLTLLCNVVYFHADSVILTLARTTAEVGVYGFAYKLFELPLVIPTFFMNSLFPLLLLSQKTGNKELFTRQAIKAGAILFSLSIVLFVCGFLSAPLLSLIKSDFRESILPFRILLCSLPVFYLTSITMWVLIALKKRTQLFFIYFISMIVNIGSNAFFIPTHGYLASAWITVISETLVFILSFLIILRYFYLAKQNESHNSRITQ